MSKPIALEVQGLSKSFGDTQVLRELSLTVYQGELVTVLGASGGGKTTLLRLIAGFDAPQSGVIALDGTVVTDADVVTPPEQRAIGIVPQDAALFPHLTVAENIAFGLRTWNPQDRTQRVQEMLNLVEMTEWANHKPNQLSGGQQQRVALARALAIKPKLVLLDEPFAALDAQLRTRLRDDVKKALRAEGASALLVTHDQDEALSIADRVAILRDGVIAQVGTPRDTYNNPVDVGLAQFLGEAVVLPAEIHEGKAQTSVGALHVEGDFAEGQAGRAVIRPENFYLQPHLDGKATVIGRQYFGHDAIVSVRTDDTVIHARTSGPLAPELGMKVTVWVRGNVTFFPA